MEHQKPSPDTDMRRLRTLPPQSASFFLAIAAGPLALALLLMFILNPRHVIDGTYGAVAWLIVLVGLISLWDAFRRTQTRFFTTTEGILRRGLIRRAALLSWDEIEAVGTQAVRSRYGVVGNIVFLYSRCATFRVMLSTSDCDSLLFLLKTHNPEILRVDEDEATFEMPRTPDQEKINALVHRHAQRLRRQHSFALLVCAMILVPSAVSIVSHLRDHLAGAADAKLALATFALFLPLSWRHWFALWRLRP